MKRYKKMYFLILCLIWFYGSLAAAAGKGYLLIIGGGDKPAPALREFVNLSKNKPILVITSASEVPQESGPETVQMLRAAGAQKINWIHIASPAMANSDSVVTMITDAGGLFFTGGVQERLMNRLDSTRSEIEILNLYFKKGGVIGGTSAGAAVMSKVMITGNELINRDTTNIFVTIQKNNVETKKGFGFLDKVIIDQHFVARKRHNRLISEVLEHPDLLGIGIDEDTAILVYPNGKFRVYGQGPVIVYNARKAKVIHADAKGMLAAKNIKIDILLAGEEYSIE
jgi:cyanophycinase